MSSIIKRTYIPGSEWVYFKIYTGVKTADWILCEKLFPIINKLTTLKIINKFFFIRYADPEFHIRIRFLLTEKDFLEEALSLLYKTLKPLVEKRLIWKIQMDTYKRELERYSPLLIEEVESLFHIDSISIIQIIKLLNKNENKDYRWMISLALLNQTLNDFGYDVNSKQELTHDICNTIKKHLTFQSQDSKLLNKTYEECKLKIKHALSDSGTDKEYNKLLTLVKKRSKRMQPFILQIIDKANSKHLKYQDYVRSYLHMSMNRLFIMNSNLNELILYDFLRRYYMSVISINKLNNNL